MSGIQMVCQVILLYYLNTGQYESVIKVFSIQMVTVIFENKTYTIIVYFDTPA